MLIGVSGNNDDLAEVKDVWTTSISAKAQETVHAKALKRTSFLEGRTKEQLRGERVPTWGKSGCSDLIKW